MIVAFPHRPGAGGPGSFQSRLEKKIVDNGWKIQYNGSCGDLPTLVFVVGGTRRLWWLIRMKMKGVPIIYRLDGINWLHRKKTVSVGNFLIAEWRNWTSKFIHAVLADYIVYQSDFSRDWWMRSGWRKPQRASVIYNGVNEKLFNPGDSTQSMIALVCLEGTLDYSPYAVELINRLRLKLPAEIEIRLYGRFENKAHQKRLRPGITAYGMVPREDVPRVLKRSIYLSLDVNPACPNTVVEALACGAPVVGFDTGALKELVNGKCAEVIPYGSDPWQLAMPDVDGLAAAILKVNRSYEAYSMAARKHALENYTIDKVFANYLQIILRVTSKGS